MILNNKMIRRNRVQVNYIIVVHLKILGELSIICRLTEPTYLKNYYPLGKYEEYLGKDIISSYEILKSNLIGTYEVKQQTN